MCIRDSFMILQFQLISYYLLTNLWSSFHSHLCWSRWVGGYIGLVSYIASAHKTTSTSIKCSLGSANWGNVIRRVSSTTKLAPWLVCRSRYLTKWLRSLNGYQFLRIAVRLEDRWDSHGYRRRAPFNAETATDGGVAPPFRNFSNETLFPVSYTHLTLPTILLV